MDKIKIRMLQTRMGTENTHEVQLYHKNREYEVSHWLSRSFFRQNVAVLSTKT